MVVSIVVVEDVSMIEVTVAAVEVIVMVDMDVLCSSLVSASVFEKLRTYAGHGVTDLTKKEEQSLLPTAAPGAALLAIAYIASATTLKM